MDDLSKRQRAKANKAKSKEERAVHKAREAAADAGQGSQKYWATAKRKAEANRNAEAMRFKVEEVSLRAEEEARSKAAEEARLNAEEVAKRKAAKEARLKAVEVANHKAAEEARLTAEEEAKSKAAEEAQLKTVEEANRKAAEEARLKIEEEANRKTTEEARLKAEETERCKATEEARLKAEEELKRNAVEEARLKAEDEVKRTAAEVEQLKAEEETKRKAIEEARLTSEEEATRKTTEVARLKVEDEARRNAAEVARLTAKEESKRKAAEKARLKEAKRKAAEEAQLTAEVEAKCKAAEEARLKAEEVANHKAEEAPQLAAAPAAASSETVCNDIDPPRSQPQPAYPSMSGSTNFQYPFGVPVSTPPNMMAGTCTYPNMTPGCTSMMNPDMPQQAAQPIPGTQNPMMMGMPYMGMPYMGMPYMGMPMMPWMTSMMPWMLPMMNPMMMPYMGMPSSYPVPECRTCGCSREFDEFGDRICFCDSCWSGCDNGLSENDESEGHRVSNILQWLSDRGQLTDAHRAQKRHQNLRAKHEKLCVEHEALFQECVELKHQHEYMCVAHDKLKFENLFLSREREETRKLDQPAALTMLTCFPRNTQHTHYRVTDMPTQDPRYRFIADLTRTSCVSHRKQLRSDEWCDPPLLDIKNIQSIVNQRLSRAFMAKLDNVEAYRRHKICSRIEPLKHLMLSDPFGALDLNEAILFHGCKDDDISKICKGGFDPRRAGERAGHMFGYATYLTPNASKADIYTEGFKDGERRSRTAERRLLLVRALLGHSFRTTRSMSDARRPPDDDDGIPFDSVWADVLTNGGAVDHLECMVYCETQTVPIAIVTYSHQPHCKCSECFKRPA